MLLRNMYQVVSVNKGKEALSLLRKKQPAVDLVLTGKLPDMSCFEFLRTVRDMGRSVLLICDAYDQSTILRGLSSGAMFCLVEPLALKDIECLWQFPIVKRRELACGSSQQPVAVIPKAEPAIVALKQELFGEGYGLPAGERPVINGTVNMSRGPWKRKLNELQRADSWSPGQSSSSPFMTLQMVQHRLSDPGWAVGLSNATQREIVQPTDGDWLTTLAAVRLQYVYKHLLPKLRSPSQMANPETASAVMRRLLSISNPQLGNANHLYANGRSSILTRFLQNPRFRPVLETTVRGALLKEARHSGMLNNPLSTPPYEAPELRANPLIAGVARAIERFIHASLSYERHVNRPVCKPHKQGPNVAQFQCPGPSRGLLPAPTLPSTPQGRGCDLSSAILDIVHGDDMINAIIDLLDRPGSASKFGI